MSKKDIHAPWAGKEHTATESVVGDIPAAANPALSLAVMRRLTRAVEDFYLLTSSGETDLAEIMKRYGIESSDPAMIPAGFLDELRASARAVTEREAEPGTRACS